MGSLINKWLLETRPRVYSKFIVKMLACMMFHFLGSASGNAYSNGRCLSLWQHSDKHRCDAKMAKLAGDNPAERADVVNGLQGSCCMSHARSDGAEFQTLV